MVLHDDEGVIDLNQEELDRLSSIKDDELLRSVLEYTSWKEDLDWLIEKVDNSIQDNRDSQETKELLVKAINVLTFYGNMSNYSMKGDEDSKVLPIRDLDTYGNLARKMIQQINKHLA